MMSEGVRAELREADEIRAERAEERGQGICRNCLAPIWNEGGTIGRQHQPEGWSDRIERGGDSLVCFRAVEYRHVPLAGREAAIYDRAFKLGAAERDALAERLAQAEQRADTIDGQAVQADEANERRRRNDREVIARWRGRADAAEAAVARAGQREARVRATLKAMGEVPEVRRSWVAKLWHDRLSAALNEGDTDVR